MRNKAIIFVLVALAGAGAFYQLRQPAVVAKAISPKPVAALISAAGRVEPVSEEFRIASELDGKLKEVLVDEGQAVRRGQVIAMLMNGDYEARVSLAQAAIREREAELERLKNGSRAEERRESAAQVREAEAVLRNASIERERRRDLLAKGAISRMEFESFEKEFFVAKSRAEAVGERRALVEAPSRFEDIKRTEAEVDRAKAQLREAQALLAKTIIYSPVDGVVLRRLLKRGESVAANGSTTIVTLGDLSRLRVRVEVDEADVSHLAVGQAAYVTASAYGDRRFTGKVSRVGKILGKKQIRSDDPVERVDTKVLETLVDLEANVSIPVGLRVDAFIEVGK